MFRRFRTRVAGIAVVSACGFTAATQPTGGGDDTPPSDAGVNDSVISDAPPDVPISTECAAAGTYCTPGGERLRMCTGQFAEPVDEICPWRCTDTPTPHCRRLQPAGNAVLPADLLPTAGLPTLDRSSVTTYVFNTLNGTFTANGQSQTLPGGWSFNVRNGVGVWRFTKLALTGTLRFTGPNAAAFVAVDEILFSGRIDLQGACDSRTAHGAGGGDGGNNAQVGGGGTAGGGSGSGNDTSCSGGGGGANGGNGGEGGNDRPGGVAIPASTVFALVGGGGGGGGGGGMGGDGGGGAGALQLVANKKVRIDGFLVGVGGIDGGGCGGKAGASCGGGGGAGGTVVIEAVAVELVNGTFAVNGGGGGGGKSGTSGTSGQFSTTRANGGPGGTSGSGDDGGSGGDGGDDNALDGDNGVDATRAGGGGGGVGRMRFHTLGGTVMTQQVVLSPGLSTPMNPTPVVQAPAKVE